MENIHCFCYCYFMLRLNYKLFLGYKSTLVSWHNLKITTEVNIHVKYVCVIYQCYQPKPISGQTNYSQPAQINLSLNAVGSAGLVCLNLMTQLSGYEYFLPIVALYCIAQT